MKDEKKGDVKYVYVPNPGMGEDGPPKFFWGNADIEKAQEEALEHFGGEGGCLFVAYRPPTS